MNVKTAAISKALLILTAANAKFKVITEDGEEYGDLQVVVPKQRTRHMQNPGASKYVRQFIGGLQVGDVGVVPYLDGVTRNKMVSLAASVACQDWGKGAYVTCSNEKGVEVLRVA